MGLYERPNRRTTTPSKGVPIGPQALFERALARDTDSILTKHAVGHGLVLGGTEEPVYTIDYMSIPVVLCAT